MSTKIGHFEILSELAKSATSVVYKANDPQTSQAVALKVIHLPAFGEYAAELERCVLEEAETTKVLSSPNLTPVFGAGEIEGRFCAAMQYIEGNSVATILARKEGFSIWDVLDIGRQVCGGFDHAHSHQIFHSSLEPAKIMCGWDGTVRILGYGVSSVGRFAPLMPGVPSILRYMSPEQVRGESIDARSNLFSLGAMFYEMVTDHPAFDGQDPKSLCRSILESAPQPPIQVNPKLHPQLSDLIMKALAKDPQQRYQSGKQLLEDLEKCKESKPQAAKKAAAAASAATISSPVKSVAQTQTQTQIQTKIAGPSLPAAQALKPTAEKKSAPPTSAPSEVAKSRVIAAGVKAIASAGTQPAISMSSSSAVLNEPATAVPQARRPKIAVDPLMAESAGPGGRAASFSEVTELPPLKEVYVPPPQPPALEQTDPTASGIGRGRGSEKPKLQSREVATQAIKEIKNVPARLMMYSIAGAGALILIVAVSVGLHVHNLNKNDGNSAGSGSDSSPATVSAQPGAQNPASASQAQPSIPADEAQPAPTHAATRGRNAKRKAQAPSAPVVAPGQLAIDSTPQGAQVQIDGKTDPSWITPFTLSGVEAGQHTLTLSRSGYSTDTRTVDVVSGSKSFVVTHLMPLVATLSVVSTPAGASVYIDGKDTGKLTPAQVPVDKGQHVVLVRKSGFIDESIESQFVLGQTVSFSPTLRALGNVDDIRTVGKIKKLFGGGAAPGMATVTIKTQPKGAQVTVNQHMLEKSSPVEVMLDPGNYIVDITLIGYAPIHKVITVDKGAKAVIDEVMQRQ